MTRTGALLVLMASIGLVSATEASPGTVLAIYRSAGLKATEPIDHYQFTVVEDGGWEFKPLKGESRKGELDAEDLNEWLQAIEEGLDQVESNPMLGALDESYMDISLQTTARKTRVRIRLSETLSQAIEKNIVELARPGQ